VEVFNRLCEYIEHDRESDTAVLLQEDPVYLTTRIYEAYFLCELGQIDRAEQICDDCLPGLLSLDMQIELVYGYLCLGIIPLYQGDYDKSRAYLNESIEYGNVTHSYEMVGALNLWLGWVYYMLKETELALAKFQESYEIFKVHKNNWGLGFALSKLGLIYDEMKDYQRAMKAYLDAREIFAGFGDLAGDAYTTSRMCMAAYGMGDYEEAIRLGEIGLERFTEIGHRWGMTVSLCRIGFPYLATGNLSEAERCFSKALARGLELQMEPLCIYALIGTACVDVARGDDTRAADLYVFAQEHPSTTPVYMDQAERWFDELKTRLTEDEFAAIESRMKGRDLEEIARNVLAERISQG
jgi:tetratricopeptide (TPR) repeat protein